MEVTFGQTGSKLSSRSVAHFQRRFSVVRHLSSPCVMGTCSCSPIHRRCAVRCIPRALDSFVQGGGGGLDPEQQGSLTLRFLQNVECVRDDDLLRESLDCAGILVRTCASKSTSLGVDSFNLAGSLGLSLAEADRSEGNSLLSPFLSSCNSCTAIGRVCSINVVLGVVFRKSGSLRSGSRISAVVDRTASSQISRHCAGIGSVKLTVSGVPLDSVVT